MNLKLPKIRGERFVIAALLMILVAEVFSTFWHLEKLRADDKFHMQCYLAESLELLGFFLLVISLISSGIRKLRVEWKSLKGISMTIIGIGFCLFQLFTIHSYQQIGMTLEELPKPNFEMMKSKLENGNLPLKSRTVLSRMYAHDKFLYEDQIVSYIADNGEKVLYVPTKQDLEFKKLKADVRRIWARNNQNLPVLFRWWIAVAVISLCLGIFTPIKKTAHNQ